MSPPAEKPARQAAAIQRFYLALGFYAIWLGLTVLAERVGMLRYGLPVVGLCALGILATNAVIYLAIRLGWGRNLKDPYLTLSQLLIGVFWAILMLAATYPEARGLMLFAYVAPMIFAMFGLTSGGFLLLLGMELFGYIGIVAADAYRLGPAMDWDAESLRSAALASMLLWTTLFGLHVSRLKTKLRYRNRELESLVAEVSALAERDDLTNAYNRRFIMESLVREKARADRCQIPFSVCIFDLDHFKRINDLHGHLTGDRVLTAFADRCRAELRAMDLMQSADGTRWFGRYGGEEFIVLLPNTSLGGATNCAERVRCITAGTLFESRFQITLSAGVTEYRIDESIEETLRRADDALYTAKQLGRNRVNCAEDEVTQTWTESLTLAAGLAVGPRGSA